jgi:sec-independent protein translocase protein TatA
MGAFSIWHWLVVLAVVLLMFGGRGKISALMGDFGKGLTSFKKGMKEGETSEPEDDAKALQADAADAPKGDQAAKS